MQQITLKRYHPDDKPMWNAFVEKAKNGLFLFYRDYMDYHASRFNDHSLIAYAGEYPLALLPANQAGGTLYSHQGLTFGGWITHSSMSTVTMLSLFRYFTAYLKAQGIKELVYKSIPHLYHGVAGEEDAYALFRHNAELMECNVTTVIDYRQALPFNTQRKRGIEKAAKAGITVRECNNYAAYFRMLEDLLQQKYNCHPTHSLPEILTLSKKFPDNIKLFSAYHNATMLAGVIIYESAHVAHAQYIASNEEGRKCGALDKVFDEVISRYRHKRYFDFGTSNERQGLELNEGLITQKEGFGGGAVTHNIYKITL